MSSSESKKEAQDLQFLRSRWNSLEPAQRTGWLMNVQRFGVIPLDLLIEYYKNEITVVYIIISLL